jgi:membrane protease YdiL (CAAX protease family)
MTPEDPDDERAADSDGAPAEDGSEGDGEWPATGEALTEQGGRVPPGPDEASRDPQEDADDDSPVSDRARAFVHGLVALGLTVFGVLASLLGAIPLFFLGRDTVLGFGLGVVVGELGFVVVALGFLLVTRRGLAYLDLQLPGTRRQWAVVVGFTVGAFVVRTLVVVVATQVGVQPAESSVADSPLPFEVVAAILFPAMLLVVGPAEELLFRGVIQKYLREATSASTAIVVAGLLFGSIHVFSLVQSTTVGALVALVVITAVGLGLGWLYEHTGSLPATMLAHGAYNALIVASAYAIQVLG